MGPRQHPPERSKASPGEGLRIGVDLDNTIVCYDALLTTLAREHGWVSGAFAGSKRDVREAVRALPEGEVRWRRLQGEAYGPRLGEARLTPGVAAFLAACRRGAAAVFVISHKTQFAVEDARRVDLQQAALDWLAGQGFFNPEGLGLARTDVFFEPDRAAKLARIAERECTHFVDDLEEVLLDPAFPRAVRRYLFAAEGARPSAAALRPFSDWAELTREILGDAS